VRGLGIAVTTASTTTTTTTTTAAAAAAAYITFNFCSETGLRGRSQAWLAPPPNRVQPIMQYELHQIKLRSLRVAPFLALIPNKNAKKHCVVCVRLAVVLMRCCNRQQVRNRQVRV